MKTVPSKKKQEKSEKKSLVNKSEKTSRVFKKTIPPLLPLVIVSDEVAFWTVDGMVFHSLVEFSHGLKKMERRVYQYHSDSKFTDFAKWVQYTLKDISCAKDLKKANSLTSAHKVVVGHLKKYNI